jgi:putative tricarboxylic transport membrane protein
MLSNMRLFATMALVAGVTIAAAAAPAPAGAQPVYPQLRIIAPAAPGGGWDQTARAMQQALQRAGIVATPVVENIPGAAGTIGLARFIGAERGNGDAIMVSGLIMLGGIVTHLSPVTLGDVVPIARITGEYEVLAVAAASPYRTLDDLLRAFKARPESISWGGGSAGGSDQILAGLVATAVGVEPRRVNYIAFSGGGESLSAIIGGQVSVGVNGLAEFLPHLESGALRALAISSADRLQGLDVPTLREQGVDVEFENWRSVVAPPGISSGDRERLEGAIAAMVRSAEWRETLTRYRWLDRHLDGPEFAKFATAEERRVQEILREFGTGRVEGATLAAAGPYPLFVLGGLVLFGFAAVVDLRRHRLPPHAEQRWPKLRSAGLIGIGIAIHIALAERAGFVIASTVLFWFTARAFDETRPLRDAVFAVVISVGAYLLFARVLQLQLPAGVLAGWL